MSVDPIRVIDEKCVGCTLCTKVCPFDAIAMDERLAKIDLTKCTVCGACVEACKFEAIEIREREVASQHDLEQFKNVWVMTEQFDGHTAVKQPIESIKDESLAARSQYVNHAVSADLGSNKGLSPHGSVFGKDASAHANRTRKHGRQERCCARLSNNSGGEVEFSVNLKEGFGKCQCASWRQLHCFHFAVCCECSVVMI